MTCDYGNLECLLKASTKSQVSKICQDVFSKCHSLGHIPDALIKQCSQSLTVSQEDAQKLIKSLWFLLKQAVFQGSVDPHLVVTLFPEHFHKSLRDLLGKIIIDNMADWKVHAMQQQVSLPKLVDFDWRVDIKTSSDSVARMSVPTCILNLQVEGNGSEGRETSQEQSVTVEMSKETLDTMLDGLTKIRDQLYSVAKR